MKIKVRALINKQSLDTFYSLIPERKRSQLIRYYLQNDYLQNEFDLNHFDYGELTGDKGSIDIFLNEQSLRKLDTFVEDVKTLYPANEVTRSTILQDIILLINQQYKNNPIMPTKSKRKPFYIPKSDKQALLIYINKREITSTIEEFLMESYNGPNKEEVLMFQRKSTEPMELIQLSLDDAAIAELDEYASYNNVNRSVILRNVVKHLLNSFRNEKQGLEEVVYENLDTLINDLKDVASEAQILEVIENYKKRK